MLDRVRLTACDGILASVCRSWPAGHAIIEHPAHPETMAADIGQDFFLSDEPSSSRHTFVGQAWRQPTALPLHLARAARAMRPANRSA